MPRDIPVGNGQLLVAFDQHYQIRDFYFPHVGQENHAGAGPCRFGVWSPLPRTPENQSDRRKRRLFWSSQGWQVRLGYLPDTLATDVVLRHADLKLELRCTDVVDFDRMVLVRRVEVMNLTDSPREVRLFHHQDFNMYGTKVGDTAYYDPNLRSVIHYRTNRYISTSWYAQGEHRIDQYATGLAGFRGAEGTWRDAEDGQLGGNPIAQGAVDSTIMLGMTLGPRATGTAYLVIGAGFNHEDLVSLHRLVEAETPQGIMDRTIAYWRLWLAATRIDFPEPAQGGLPENVVELFKRSLLVMRTQIDNQGAIIAANDSDIMQFSRDTYSYLWPRDGALVAASLDAAGFPDIARSFYSLCARIITSHGCFLHKYNPDGSLASSWHPWVSKDRPSLPIQEDGTALVVWALWRHYTRYRDIEFVRALWGKLITPAADFLARYRDPETHLPLPSYDLWEERWGVHAFTVAAVYGGLQAAWQFALCFGDQKRAALYSRAAEETRQAFCRHFWSEEHDRFLRRIVPLDHDRTADLVSEVLAGRTPGGSDGATKRRSDEGKDGRGTGGNGRNGAKARGKGKTVEVDSATLGPTVFERDAVLDSSMYAIFGMGLVSVHDPRVEKTMAAVRQRLWVKTPVGGLARYEGDYYHRTSDDTRNVPGNPWFLCTLWLAEWHIAKAQTVEELKQALPIFEWVVHHAMPSGVLAEQVHPHKSGALSVSPLTWSHATMVGAVVGYLQKLQAMSACPTCGQPQRYLIGDAESEGAARSVACRV